MLVEEWDGYTWRRVFGNAPAMGRQVYNVHVIDSLPAYINFGGIVSLPAGASVTYTAGTRIFDASLATVAAGQCGEIKYWAVAADPGCPTADLPQSSQASVYGDNEQLRSSPAQVTISCAAQTATQTMQVTPSRTSTATPTASQAGNATPTWTVSMTVTKTYIAVPSATDTPTVIWTQGQMTLTKSSSMPFANYFNTITYSITYKNNNAGGITNYSLWDTLPGGLQYVTSTAGSSLTGSMVTWPVGDVAPLGTGRWIFRSLS